MSKGLIYQFRVALLEVEPTVWRRIQVPIRYSFWDLHVAIQDSMGWQDHHLHAFRIKKPRGRKFIEIGIPDDELADETLPGWTVPIFDHFTYPGTTAIYEYDFGDRWIHDILLEGILLPDPEAAYPLCLAGERSCPPEDCGGPPGYERLLGIMRRPDHPEYEETTTWLATQAPGDQPFRADLFDPANIRFSDPKERFKIAIAGH